MNLLNEHASGLESAVKRAPVNAAAISGGTALCQT